MILLLSADFFQYLLFQKILSGTLSECQLNSLDPDQGRLSAGLDLGPNCLQRLPADVESRRKQGKCLRAFFESTTTYY